MDIANVLSDGKENQSSGESSALSALPGFAGGGGTYAEPDSLPAAAASDVDVVPSPRNYWIKVTLQQLPVDGRVKVFLKPTGKAVWAMGDAGTNLVGVALATSNRSAVLKVSNFIINRRKLVFEAYAACEEISLEICVRSNLDVIRGYVDLPASAIVTFQSEVDRTSLIGLSSFALGISI